jgi:CDP-paratose 2-epimerase
MGFERMKVLVTAGSGLIASEAVERFARRGHEVTGADNNMRLVFFGPAGDTLDTLWNLERLKSVTKGFTHSAAGHSRSTGRTFWNAAVHLIVHCAAHPSHDKARAIPLPDFEVSALCTVFVFLSTNKVYGYVPKAIPLKELEKWYDYEGTEDGPGVTETCRTIKGFIRISARRKQRPIWSRKSMGAVST